MLEYGARYCARHSHKRAADHGKSPVANDASHVYDTRKIILAYASKNIYGKHKVRDDGKEVIVTRKSIEEVLWCQTSPKMAKGLIQAKLKSALMVPQIIEGMKYIGTYPNEDAKVDTDSFGYYLSLVRIDGNDWVIRSVVAELRSGGRCLTTR